MTTDDVDLSVILTAHDETLVAGPTMAAADAAVAAAEAVGITVERIITLDNATPEAAAWFGQDRFAHWDRRVMTEGDLGRVRNAIVPQTRGRFIAFLDADDLFSENWLREGVLALRRAEAEGQRAIAHPELNWLFDGAHSVFCKPDLDDPLYSPWHFYFMNYYDSLCMSPREAHLAHPYVHRDIPAGLSFQDWQFSIETIAAGWHHLAARDTIIFKRRRDNSLVTESRARRALVRPLEAMAIDRVDGLGRTAPKRPLPPTESPAPPMDVPAPAEFTETETNFGENLTSRAVLAKRRRGHVRPEHKDIYTALEGVFDDLHYMASNRDIATAPKIDPLAHYIRAGAREGRDPAPWFSTADYLARHPDVAQAGANPLYHWLTEGREAGIRPYPVTNFEEISATIGLAPETALELWQNRFSDLRNRLIAGELGAQARKAAEIEPLIEQGWLDALVPKIPPFHADRITVRTAGIWNLAQAADMQRATYVVCVNCARFGAAPRIEGQIVRSLATRVDPKDIVVVTTEEPGPMPEGKFPDGVRVVDFAALTPEFKGDARQRLLAEFLRALAPKAAFNVNSRLMWDMMGSYGRAVRAGMDLYACLLCNERTPLGFATGYPLRRVYRHFDDLTGIFTDSIFLAEELRDRHMLTPEDAGRIAVLSNPVDPGIDLARPLPEDPAPKSFWTRFKPARPAPAPEPEPAETAEPHRPQIFWAGRFDAQKRVDLAHAIAEAMPECDLRMWGSPVMSNTPVPKPPENVTHEGAYARFENLPLRDADLWLYTSAWDGVPSMLLEVAMTGIPMVGSDVGGTREALQDGLAQAMSPEATPQDWASTIRRILENPDTARRQAATLRNRLIETRNPTTHAAALFALLDKTS